MNVSSTPVGLGAGGVSDVKVSPATTRSVDLISKLLKSEGWAAPLLDVGAADDADADDVEVLDAADDEVDDGLDGLSLPQPVTAAPTSRVPATKAGAIIDTFSKIGSFAVRSQLAAYRNIAGMLNSRTHEALAPAEAVAQLWVVFPPQCRWHRAFTLGRRGGVQFGIDHNRVRLFVARQRAHQQQHER